MTSVDQIAPTSPADDLITLDAHGSGVSTKNTLCDTIVTPSLFEDASWLDAGKQAALSDLSAPGLASQNGSHQSLIPQTVSKRPVQTTASSRKQGSNSVSAANNAASQRNLTGSERARVSQRRQAGSMASQGPTSVSNVRERRKPPQSPEANGASTNAAAGPGRVKVDGASSLSDQSCKTRTARASVSLAEQRGPSNLQSIDRASRTELMYAAGGGDPDVDTIERLIAEGAQVDATDSCGCTALMYAADRGRVEAAQSLLGCGAQVILASHDGWTPLSIACARGHHQLVWIILQLVADVDSPDALGWTPLMHAGFCGHTIVVEYLLGHAASSSVEDQQGRSALTLAAYQGHLEVVQLLLCADACTTTFAMLQGHGRALEAAVLQNHVEVVRALLGSALPPDAKQLAVKLAVDQGRHQVVEVLVRHASVENSVKSMSEGTPHDYA